MDSPAPFQFFVALDGQHLDGLIGGAGLLRYDWPTRAIRTEWYPGLSGGHNVSIAVKRYQE